MQISKYTKQLILYNRQQYNYISNNIYFNFISYFPEGNNNMSDYFRKYIKRQYYPIHPSEIKFKTFFVNTIRNTLQNVRGYKYTQDDDWNVYWCQKQFIPETLDKIRLFPNKRVNHFRNWYQICRKDLLAKNVKRFKKALDKQGKYQEANTYNFMPLTYNLPTQYPIFLEQFKRSSRDKAVWIMKPIGRSQGKGIFLFNRIADISEWSQMANQPQPYIVQRYINKPLLIGHKKFDLRIYVLVISHNPLVIYLYREGFARLTHYRYNMDDIDNLQRHLTNVAVQKSTGNYDEQRGGKYWLRKLRVYLLSKYDRQKVQNCFYLIQELVIKTLLATSKLMITDKRCFQLYGFDVMLDSDLKPWLIQVNGSPSMTATTSTDQALKSGLVDDTLSIINIQGLLSGQETQIGGFDLIYKNNKRIKQGVKDFSFLGCLNNREQNMRKMAKLTALRLAQNKKQLDQKNKRGKSTATNNTNHTTKSSSTYGHKNSLNNHNRNDQSLKLPKLINNSNKNIEGIRKPTQGIFRTTNSKQSRR